jgi:glutamyl-tRNA synthetase
MTTVTRIAPSPTGYLHFGLARTALFSYLYAKQQGGKFLLRIEDTDLARNNPEFERDIDDELQWLGLTWDARYKQSEHRARHTECLQALVQKGLAYESEEPAKDDASRTVRVIRLKNPGETVVFTDLIRGEIRFDTKELGDFVVARSLEDPLYHMAVVVDDEDESVTHIIRGEDHISNTPRHILLQRALGFKTPHYAHIPLILMPDRSKMSKRKEGSSVKHYRELGVLPEALINYLALLGWNAGDDREFFTLDELVKEFDIGRVHKSGAIFDETKLLWLNHEYLKRLEDSEYLRRLEAFGAKAMPGLVPLLKERAKTFSDAASFLEGELAFVGALPPYEPALLVKGAKVEAVIVRDNLNGVRALLENLSEASFSSSERVKEAVFDFAGEKGRASVLWPLRVALTGMEKSPDPFTVAAVLGKEETLRRITHAIETL